MDPKDKKSALLMRNRIVLGSGFLTTCLTTYRTGAHGDKSARERVLTTFVYQKGLNEAEMSRKW